MAIRTIVIVGACIAWLFSVLLYASKGGGDPKTRTFTLCPVGLIEQDGKAVRIRIDPACRPAMQGLEGFSHVWVLYWFDRNDTPPKRQILQVHPRGNPRNPLTGVFACRAPVRPNLIAMSLCKIVRVAEDHIQVERIDAFDKTPVLDLKPYLPGLDRTEKVKVPSWVAKSPDGRGR